MCVKILAPDLRGCSNITVLPEKCIEDQKSKLIWKSNKQTRKGKSICQPFTGQCICSVSIYCELPTITKIKTSMIPCKRNMVKHAAGLELTSEGVILYTPTQGWISKMERKSQNWLLLRIWNPRRNVVKHKKCSTKWQLNEPFYCHNNHEDKKANKTSFKMF